MRRTAILALALAAAFTARAGTLILEPEGGILSGSPGTTVSWNFTYINDSPDYWAILADSRLHPDVVLGTYEDNIDSNFFVVSPGDRLPSTLLGSYHIGTGAQPGRQDFGLVSLLVFLTPFDPSADYWTPEDLVPEELFARYELTVADPLPDPAQVPEPGTTLLVAGGLLLAAAVRRKRSASLLVLLLPVFAADSRADDAYSIIRRAPRALQSYCHPENDTTVAWGCCGSPGSLACLEGCVSAGSNSMRGDSYSSGRGTECNLAPPSCDSRVTSAINGTGDTFYLTSDLHFFRPSFAVDDQIHHVAVINQFAQAHYAWKAFGLPTDTNDRIAPPRAVIVNGDLGLDGSANNLGSYRLLWEPGTIPESIQYPVFPGLGNHDVRTQVDSTGAHRMLDYVSKRMSCSGVSVDRQGDNGSGNYSWDFGRVHFVQLGNWAGERQSKYVHVSDGLAWLKSDLERRVGVTGRPVVLLQHAPMASIAAADTESWDSTDFYQFWNVIRDYNVIGMFAGHTHASSVERAEGAGLSTKDSQNRVKIFDEFVSGTGGSDQRGSFIVARVTSHYLDTTHVLWRKFDTMVPITAGYYGAPAATACRKRINDWIIPLGSAIVAVNAPSSGTSRTVVLTSKGIKIPGPAALKLTVPGKVELIGRTFTDACGVADGGDKPSSSYILLTDDQLAALNSGQLSLPVAFSEDPTSIRIELVQLTPIKTATPQYVQLTVGVGANPPAASDPGPQQITLTGPALEGLGAKFIYPSLSVPDWLVLDSVPSQYDAFGRAVIHFHVNTAVLKGYSQGLLQASLIAATSNPNDLYTVPVSLTFKVATTIDFSVDPPVTVDPASTYPVFTAKLKYPYPATDSTSNDVVKPTGTMRLYILDKGLYPRELSHFNVNTDGAPDSCNLPPPDLVYFNWQIDTPQNPHRYCPSYDGAGSSNFAWPLDRGLYVFQVGYDGDGKYAPYLSAPIEYRVGAQPARLTIFDGDAQSIRVGNLFNSPLVVRALDARGALVFDFRVVFSAPNELGKAGALFGSSPTLEVLADARGVASAPFPTANGIPGTYPITATIKGLPISVQFKATNLPLNSLPDPQPYLTARAGALGQRLWSITIGNRGGGTALGVELTGLSLVQTGGPACTAVPTVIGPLPQNFGGVSPGSLSNAKQVQINFGGCQATSRFSATFSMRDATGATYSTTLGNAFP